MLVKLLREASNDNLVTAGPVKIITTTPVPKYTNDTINNSARGEGQTVPSNLACNRLEADDSNASVAANNFTSCNPTNRAAN